MEREAYQDGKREAWQDILTGYTRRLSFLGLRYAGRSEEYATDYQAGYDAVWNDQTR